MEVYKVGGCIRDYLMGEHPSDIDYVVVGSSVEEMLLQGYEQVGADFPVFLDSKGDEYALARTERKKGNKHTDFEVVTENVTLKDDLRRRDLTINAMAAPINDTKLHSLVDPYGGRKDLRNKILRHVDDEAFREDPLRVLRIARFLARWPDFMVDGDTFALCKRMAEEGELKHLTPERVAQEMRKTFCYEGAVPSRFFTFLRMIGGLKDTFPEIDALIDVSQPYRYHPEGDVFLHTMMVLDKAAEHSNSFFYDEDKEYKELMQFCALTHDLGKAVSPKDNLPHHFGHEAAGVPIVKQMCERLKLPNEFRNHATVVCRFHTHIHNFMNLNAKTIVKMFDELKINQNKFITHVLPEVSRCDSQGRTSFFGKITYPNARIASTILNQLTTVKARDICTPEELENVNIIKNKMFHKKMELVTTLRERFRNS